MATTTNQKGKFCKVCDGLGKLYHRVRHGSRVEVCPECKGTTAITPDTPALRKRKDKSLGVKK